MSSKILWFSPGIRLLEISETREGSGALMLALGFPFWSETCYFSFQWPSLPPFKRDIVLLIFCPPDALFTLFPSALYPEGQPLLTASPRPPCSLVGLWEALAGDWWEEERDGHFFLPSPGAVSSSRCFSPTSRFLFANTSSHWAPFGNKHCSFNAATSL